MSDKFMKVALPALLAFASVAPGAAMAQTTDDGEIVVTAQRRQERLQDVPVAVTALTAQSLETQSISDVRELMRVTPSLTTRTFPGDNTSATVNLRGLVDTDNLISRDPAVGSYIDGVYIGRATGGNMGMLDVARVEVLRGPQGTLFGRNTIGGAINIVPNAPSDEFEGSVAGGIGNYNAWNVEGVLNIPLTQEAAFRVAARHTERDGFAESSLTGAELNADNSDFIRAAFKLDATPDLSINLGGDYYHTQNDGQWVTLGLVQPGGRLALEYDLGDDNMLNGSRTLTPDPFDDTPAVTPGTALGSGFTAQVWGVNGTISWNLGPGTLRSISAYRELYRDNRGNDLDGTPAIGIQQFQDYTDQSQFSQEVQYFGEAMDGRLDYIFGVYHFSEEGANRSRSQFLPLVTDCLTPGFVGCDGIPAAHSVTDGSGENTSSSIFAQFGIDITEQLKLNFGARYVEDERDLTLFSRNVLTTAPLESQNPADVLSCTTAGLGGTPANLCAYEFPTATFNYTPFTVGLDYRVNDDVLLYAKYSRGFRAGGFNIRASSALAVDAFDPEQADTTEIGIKSDFFDRMLHLNAAAYHTVYQDIQLTAVVSGGGTTPTTTIRNAGEGEVTGLEIESVLRLGNFSTSLTYAYTNAEYTEIDPSVPPTVVTLDSAFIMTPEHQASISGDYRLPLGENEMNFHVGYDWRDDTAFAPVPPSMSGNVQEAYGLWNARVSFELPTGLTVALWGENLADEEYIITTTDLVGAGLGFLPFYPGDPQTYGVSLRYEF